MNSRTILAGCALFCATSTYSLANMITLDAAARAYSQNDGSQLLTGPSPSGAKNYGDAYFAASRGGSTYRNWFAFDLSGVTQPVVSATLRLENPNVGSSDILGSQGPDNTYLLWTVESDFAAVSTSSNSVDVFNDLGDGRTYGAIDVSETFSNGRLLSINLNSRALTAINSIIASPTENYFMLGGRLVDETVNSKIFRKTWETSYGPFTTELELVAVPEPATNAAIGVAALIGFVGYRRLKKKAATKAASKA